MRSAVIAAPRTIRLEEGSLPEPSPTQVRIRLEGCGVCASNVPVWDGRPWFQYPLEAGSPGHEGWGAVDAIGSAVTGLEVGQRVAVLSYRAFADYDLADAEAVVPIPAALDGVPVPGEPLGCAWNVFRRSEIQSGETVAIVGIGFLGALLVQLAKQAGARVIALSRRPYALKVARQCGADHVFGCDDPREMLRSVRTLVGDRGCERVIEATGKQEPLTLAGELVGVRGRLIIAGYHQDGLRQVDLQSWNWRGIDVINAHERDPAIYIEGIRHAMGEILNGRLDPLPLYTHTFPLEELSTALRFTHERPDGFLKALIKTTKDAK